MRKKMRKLFCGYGLLNLFLFLGILVSLIDHKELPTFIAIGVLLPFLDWTDTKPGRFTKTEVISKIIWLLLMLVLSIEAIIIVFNLIK